jgi:hypothetical protein
MTRIRSILFPKNARQPRTCFVFAAIEGPNRCACGIGPIREEAAARVGSEHDVALWWLALRWGRLVGSVRPSRGGRRFKGGPH